MQHQSMADHVTYWLIYFEFVRLLNSDVQETYTTGLPHSPQPIGNHCLPGFRSTSQESYLWTDLLMFVFRVNKQLYNSGHSTNKRTGPVTLVIVFSGAEQHQDSVGFWSFLIQRSSVDSLGLLLQIKTNVGVNTSHWTNRCTTCELCDPFT